MRESGATSIVPVKIRRFSYNEQKLTKMTLCGVGTHRLTALRKRGHMNSLSCQSQITENPNEGVKGRRLHYLRLC